VETSVPWEFFIYDGKWGPRSEIVPAGTRCLITVADEASATIRLCDSATYPELDPFPLQSWCMPYGTFNDSSSAFIFTNGFKEQHADRQCWNKFRMLADAVECSHRHTLVGDVVLRKVGRSTDTEQSGHQMCAGETAVVVELGLQGGFRLLDARGFLSEAWQQPEEYVFTGVHVSDSELRSALTESQVSARAVAMNSLRVAHQRCGEEQAKWFGHVAETEKQLLQAQNVWHVQQLGTRPKCKYGETCFQQNAAHKTRFCHPSDYDWNVTGIPDRAHLCQSIVATVTCQERGIVATSLAGDVLVHIKSMEPVTLGHIRKEIARSRGCCHLSIQIVSAGGAVIDGPDDEVFQRR